MLCPRVEAGGFVEKLFSSKFTRQLGDTVSSYESEEVAGVRWWHELDTAIVDPTGNKAGEV